MPWHTWSPEERLAWAIPHAEDWRAKIKNWRELGDHSAAWIAREEAALKELERLIAIEKRAVRKPAPLSPAPHHA